MKKEVRKKRIVGERMQNMQWKNRHEEKKFLAKKRNRIKGWSQHF